MALKFSRYIDITSGVGAGAAVAERELIGRLFTINPLVPTGGILEFNNADEVSDYFGGTSGEEYSRAAFYFARISKNITKAQKISFARWVDADTEPMIFGNIQTQALGVWTSITTGSLGLTIGADVNTFTGMDFSGAGSLSAVAAILQTEIRTATGTMWTAATVVYNSTRGSFDFVGGDDVAAVISVQQGVGGVPIGNTVGWLTGPTLILSNGSLAEDITDVLINSTNINNNFGTFVFMPELDLDQATEASLWAAGENNQYEFSTRVGISTYASWSAALVDNGGTSLTLDLGVADEWPDQDSMMIKAATDYSKQNSVQNYMFQQFAQTPSVTDDSLANTLDAARVNYYGQTQTAGQLISFYQRGKMMGGATDAVDMNVFANEQWLKDAAGAVIMTLLLALAKVSANTQGRAQILTVLQDVIDRALFNGTISVGKTLTTVQKLFITEITGDDKAWYQVQNIGYWVDCVIVPIVVDDVTEYHAQYTLVYSKDDVIRKVDGTHVLI